MTETTKTTEVKINKIDLVAHEVEKNAIIVSIDGWRMRVYFDKNMSKTRKEGIKKGQTFTVEYTGELKDIHSVKLLPLK